MIPLTWIAGGTAVLVALAGVSGYVKGRSDVRALWEAERQGYRVAAAQAQAVAAERVRMWTRAITVAGAKYDERIKAGDSWAATQLDRMRDATATSDRVRAATETPAGCPATRGPRQADLLAASREIIELARDADQDRAGLIACLEAWPR